MNESPRKVSPLRQRMIEEMRMRQLAPKTRDAYIRAVLHFTRFLGRSPDTATAEDLRRYQLHCVDQGISAITLNATITGLKFFFEATLGQPELMAKMHPVRMSAHLADHLKSRGSEPPARCGEEPQASNRAVGRVWGRTSRQRSDRARRSVTLTATHAAARRAG